MEDKLRGWVNAQREEFEVYDFDPDAGWEDIATGISQKRSAHKTKIRWFSLAASVALLAIAAIVAIPIINSPADPAESIFSESYELAEARDYYTSEINMKLTAARKLVDDPAIFRDIEELDKAYAELQDDLRDNADNEEVIIAMMENYQLKLKILDRILKHLKKDDEKEKKEGAHELI